MFIIALEPSPPALFLSSSSPEETMQSLLPNGISIARIICCRSPLCFSAFHSTPVAAAKRKSKWDCKADKYGPKPSKSYIRYAVRQKRAEIKKALKVYLFYGKTSKLNFQDESFRDFIGGARETFNTENGAYDFDATSTSGSGRKVNFHSSSCSGKCKHGRSKGRQKGFYDEHYHEHSETIYEADFGQFRGFSWSQEAWENFHFNKSGKQFEWKDESKRERTRSAWSGSDDDDESTDVGLHLHRVTLGLPPTGPLKLVDVKSAFRVSALKWHPDKHQGPSQAKAAEKFKLCVDAYNYLCSVLKAT
ncbi:uncharacterized protein LOC122009178 isoform X2 [Zingiber officinale]|uniref:J domain-containing protein n=1 Tax=Zingiber officinale TaxID=94328 RepID=A0A8J5FFM3_ZINOF|nr:uncharacterized protein LOC122009178 isoform X2 [Zingiber officinale]KAG6486777.1 hypothetical protein ZIOFF_055357 [Zingiber officinale]